MPRQQKQRRCRRLEKGRFLKPSGIPACELETVELNIDEFEALRLCDYDGLSQIEAAESMEVSRGTVQRLLNSGRKKVVDILLHQKALLIQS